MIQRKTRTSKFKAKVAVEALKGVKTLSELGKQYGVQAQVQLKPGDVVVLDTDGITEAEDINGVYYGLERLCKVVSLSWQRSSSEIKQAIALGCAAAYQ